MEIAKIAIMATVLLGLSAGYANEKDEKVKSEAPTAKQDVVKTLTGEKTKSRKKKVEICAECGKPETECECEGHKNEK